MIVLGTSGYSFDDWVGPFYPPGTARSEMLTFYARHFRSVEINATYYRILPPRTFERMASSTPDGFEFVVKGHRSMTHERAQLDAEVGSFLSSIAPLRQAEKFSGVLLQFPHSFRNSPPSLDHLKRAREHLTGMSVFVEFRHDSWNGDAVFASLNDLGLGYCVVDEPDLPGLMPPVARITADEAYVRFHGRNRLNWWGRGDGDRYDYLYSEDELKGWVGKIRTLAARTRKTFVFFNNCHRGQAVTGARMMERLLETAIEEESDVQPEPEESRPLPDAGERERSPREGESRR